MGYCVRIVTDRRGRGGSDSEIRTLSISARVILGDTVHIQIVSSSRSLSIKTAIVFTDLGKEGF